MWLPDPSSIYFAVLGGLLFGLLAGLYHPLLRQVGLWTMLTFVFFFFLGLQLVDRFVTNEPNWIESVVRITSRFYIFTFSAGVGLAILRQVQLRRVRDSLS